MFSDHRYRPVRRGTQIASVALFIVVLSADFTDQSKAEAAPSYDYMMRPTTSFRTRSSMFSRPGLVSKSPTNPTSVPS